MSRERLVVIGNGMAGARLVEDVLALGGGDRFDITMFGDEPYGNYNRILLSGVLAGTHDPRDIFINPLEWYTRSQVRLHAGVRAERVVRDTRTVEGDGGVRERFDHLVFATGSMPFVPPIEGLAGPGGDWRRGVFVFRYEKPEVYAAIMDGEAPPTPTAAGIPVVYRVDLEDPTDYFASQRFLMRDNDMIYVSAAPATDVAKFFGVIGSGIGVARSGSGFVP